jgi:hypothetical protein
MGKTPAFDWPLRIAPVTGDENLLRQDPGAEERIPVNLILDKVLSDIDITPFSVVQGVSNPPHTGASPSSSFFQNTETGEWFVIDADGNSYSLRDQRARVISGAVVGSNLVLTRDDASSISINLPPGGSPTESSYSVSSGSTSGYVWATGLGVTIQQGAAGSGDLTVSIPSGVELIRLNLFMPSSATDGGKYNIKLVYDGLRGYNTTKQNILLPLVRCGLDNYATASTANPANVSENGGNTANTVTYGVSEFGGGDGSDLTITMINFALGINQMCTLNF